MLRSELDVVLEKHEKWLNGMPGGSRANLSGFNLARFDLSNIDLSKALMMGTDLMEMRDGVPTVVDETDSYKPVVWLTCLEDFGPEELGLSKAKQQVQIAIPYNKEKHLWWVDWKDKNRMKKSWFKRLTGHGERYGSWYICEEPIPMSDFAWAKDMTTGEILYYQGD